MILGVLSSSIQSAQAAPKITLFLAGDVLPGRGVQQRLIHDRTTLQIYANPIKNADIAFCNLEGAPETRATQRNPHFQIEDLKWLKKAGFDVVSLANNHTLDAGEAGLQKTQTQLKVLKIGNAGASWSTQPFIPWQTTIRGQKIVVIAATQWPPFASGRARLQQLQTTVLCQQVRQLKNKGIWPIVSLHWGVEGRSEPTEVQRKTARALIDAGALAIVGHHPHVAGKTEWYQGRPIFYSLGNFLWDHMATAQSGLAAQLTIEGGSQPKVTCRTWPVIPDAAPATAEPKLPILSNERIIQRLSGHFLRGEKAPQTVTWTRRPNDTSTVRLWKQEHGIWRAVATSQPFDLRRIEVGDVNGDGLDELIAQLFQPSKLEVESRPRLHIMGADTRRGWFPLWRGSHLSRPFLDWTLLPRRVGQGYDLVARELNQQRDFTGVEWLTLYRWNGFGFRVAWQISVRGRIANLSVRQDSKGPLLTFTRVREGKSMVFHLRHSHDTEEDVELLPETAAPQPQS